MKRVAVILAGIVLGTSFACAQEQEPPAAAPDRYPPNNVLELKEMFDPQLEPLGLRLTRGALIERATDTYSPSSKGNHLALYVEPIGASTRTRSTSTGSSRSRGCSHPRSSTGGRVSSRSISARSRRRKSTRAKHHRP
jgi:hypothetical protein